MQLQFDEGILQWFSEWNGDFDWDEGNLDKNEKHGITRDETERIYDNPIYVAGKIVESDEEPRWLVLGETGNKGWALVITIREQKLRVISCRRQRKKEVLLYENCKEEIINPREDT